MRIGIDVDGVLSDFITAFKSVVGQEYPNAKIPESISTWKFEDDITDLSREQIKEIYKEKFCKQCFQEALPFSEAVPAFWTLEKWAEREGHELVIVTSQVPENRHYTLSWLGKYNLNPKQVIFAKGKYKWIEDIDYLIDDSPVNHKYWVENREDKDNFIVFDRSYNQDIESKYRINHLLQIKEIVERC